MPSNTGDKQPKMGILNISLLIVALNLRARHRSFTQSRRIRIYPVIKRIVETVLSVIVLILLAPMFLLITLAIRWDSPGSALFCQTRIGKNGKPFTCYKFRTMYEDIDRRAHDRFLAAYVNGDIHSGSNGRSVFKPIGDNQITRVGRFLRKTSLDEAPQIINIIRGDMSFIGPRPNIPTEVEAYQDWHRKRLEVLPGITGLAQIRGRSSIPFDQIVRYDVEYVESESLKMDLHILWHTVPTVLLGSGAE
jgi:lipopolysaccharide/colanic/teichoic acid biosynthesis glycosyltransferase